MLEQRDNDSCVKVNIFVKCDDCSRRRDDLCAEVNIYVECEKCEKRKGGCSEGK